MFCVTLTYIQQIYLGFKKEKEGQSSDLVDPSTLPIPTLPWDSVFCWWCFLHELCVLTMQHSLSLYSSSYTSAIFLFRYPIPFMQAWYTSWETTPHTQSDTLYTKWKKTCHWYFVSFQWPEKNTCPVNEGYRVQVLVESKSKKDGIAGIWEKNEVGKKFWNDQRYWTHVWQRNKPRRGLE